MNKLSKLQRFILTLARKNGSVSNADILIEYFGFIPTGYGKLQFDRQRIGLSRYLSASASVARSLTRLRARGLMVRQTYPFWKNRLTEEGRVVSKTLSNG